MTDDRPPNPAQVQAAELTRIRELLEADLTDRRAARRQASPPRPTPRAPGLLSGDDALPPYARWLAALKAVPGFMQQFIQVPAAYWQAEVGREGEDEVPVAAVRCPCGAQPIVEVGHECTGTLRNGEPCKRFYLYLAGRLYVTNSPLQRRPRWLTITDDWRRADRGRP